MADADLEARFKKAVWLIRNGPKIENTSNEKKLEFYSYYKQAEVEAKKLPTLAVEHSFMTSQAQATEGDVKGSQPWAVQLEARAKWDAWNKLKGMSKQEAMQRYIDLMGNPAVWEEHDTLQQYPGPQWMTT